MRQMNFVVLLRDRAVFVSFGSGTIGEGLWARMIYYRPSVKAASERLGNY
jgi:hypothetical protein